MEIPRITRKQIHIVSKHSQWPANGIKKSFEQEGIYANKASWAKFTDVALLGLGVAFAVAGIIFFFAYNWHSLHKFVKLGIMQGLVVIAVLVVLFAKLPVIIKNIILTGTSVLVGVLFSVFGQIYQTGAEAYDFFLGWTVFIFIWAIVAEFAPLWLILTLLINTTVVFYSEQVGPNWETTTLCLVLFAINVGVIALTQLVYRKRTEMVPGYFSKIVALGAAGCITVSIVAGIFESYTGYDRMIWAAILALILVYGFAIKYSLSHRSLFYLCIIPLSVIIIISAWIIKLFKGDNSGGLFFVVSLFVIISITLLVNALITLNRSWNGNK